MGISSALGSSALLPAGLGFRNKIINGGFDIWQRGGTGGYTPTSGLIEGADRWYQWWNSATGTRNISRSLFPLGQTAVPDNPKYHLTINTSVLGTGQTVHDIWQKIENVNTFAGQTVTLSFWWKSTNATIQSTPFVSQNFGTGGSPSGTVDLFVQTQSLVSANVWTKYSASFVVPSISGKTLGTSNDNLMLGLRFGIGVACTIDVANVQLEANYSPTPFEQRPIGVELALCQRYCFNFGVASGKMGMPALFRSSTTADALIIFPVEMRSAPSAPAATSGNNFRIFNATDANADFSGNIYDSNPKSLIARFSTAAQSTGISAFVLSGTTTPLIFSAEL